MDNIIPIREGQFPVSARDLHEFLQVETRFADWFGRRVGDFEFKQGSDWVLLKSEKNPEGGRPPLDYFITLSMAKELSMVERNERGKQARQYFIACENRLKALIARPALPQSYAEALRELAGTVEQKALLEAKVEADKPMVTFALAVKGADGTQTMNEIAKVLGWGEYKLFAYLRDRCILMKDNLPLQKYMTDDRPYFEVIETIIPTKKGTRIHAQTVVTPKGLIWLQRIVPPPTKHGFPGCKEHAMEAAR